MDLKQYIESTQIPLTKVSSDLKISKAMLSQVANGHRIPSLSLIQKMYEYSEKQITLDDYAIKSDKLKQMIFVVENCRIRVNHDSLRH